MGVVECEALAGEFSSPRGRQADIGVGEYVWRLMAHMYATADEMVAALALVDRALGRGGLALSWRNVHRLYGAALVLVAKFENDKCYPNSYYARVVGIPTPELNAIEVAMLARVAFQAWVAPAEVSRYMAPVQALAEALASHEAEEQSQQQPLKRRRTAAPEPRAAGSNITP
eukprot:m51a1_g5028 hypothetical protein (172) ;mRNA; r:351062-351577